MPSAPAPIEPVATILVVDDIESNRALARDALEDAGHRIVEAASGVEALALFVRERPDCVLLDVRMPGVDGIETCERLRTLPGGARTPVIFVTALRDVETFDHAMLAGGFDFLTKPVKPTELVTRVRAALALKQTSAERDELSELLKRQRDDLTRAVLMNERLAAFLVHDLKNPVAGMQLAAELIQKDQHASERSRELAGLIRTQSGEVLRMILGLLDISRAEEGRLVLAKGQVDLGPLLATIAGPLGVRARARKVEIAVDVVGVGSITVDVNLFRRVVENLLDNAIRHAPPSSVVTVRARAVGEDKKDLELSVSDAGPGVPPELRERVFDRFVQAEVGPRGEGTGRSRAGRGLGLTFCKLVVEAHGGSIVVADARGPGDATLPGPPDASPGALFVTRWPHAI